MDPLAAIGLANNIVAFVEFASKIITGAHEVYSSATGTTSNNADMALVIGDVRAMTRRLHVVKPVTDDDIALQDLVVKCQELSTDLISTLSRLQTKDPKSKTASMRVAWRAMRSKDKVESLEKRIERYRAQILDRILIMMREETSEVHLLLKETSHHNAMLADQSRSDLRNLQDQMLNTVESLRVERATQFGPDFQEMLAKMYQLPTMIGKEDLILDSLHFEEMHKRELSIEEAHEKTFRWLLYTPAEEGTPEHSQDAAPGLSEVADSSLSEIIHKEVMELESERRKQAREIFLKWLKSNSGVFHISGKAGSGKSTLMKFLGQDTRTTEELETWAGDKKLIFARFYFWSAGTETQRDLDGLYRNILWEILRLYPGLIKTVFPSPWSTATPHKHSRVNFATRQLAEAFDLLTSCDKIFQHHKVCLFIDGLDEFSGDHWKLAQSLKAWSHNDLKICVSSRPYNEFKNTFTEPSRRFQLHELTEEDIRRYVRTEFQNDERFIRAYNRDPDYSRLVDSLVSRAEGVFLWVRLVTRELLGGMGNSYSVAQLEDDLKQLPTGLEALFRKMLTMVSQSDRVRAARHFLLFSASVDGRYYIVHAAMDELYDGNTEEPQIFTRDRLTDMQLSAEERINSRCKGFLEPTNDSFSKISGLRSFEPIHRSVFDFLHKKDVRAELCALSGFADGSKALCNSVLLLLKSSYTLLYSQCLVDTARDEMIASSGHAPLFTAQTKIGSFYWISQQIALLILRTAWDSDSHDKFYAKALETAYSQLQRLSSCLPPSDAPQAPFVSLGSSTCIVNYHITSRSDDLEGQTHIWIALCCLLGLSSFVLARAESLGLLQPTARVNLLLLASLGYVSRTHSTDLSISSLLRTLLDRGISPNWTFPNAPSVSSFLNHSGYSISSDQTTWEIFLQVTTVKFHDVRTEGIRRICDVFEHYLERGADTTVVFVGYMYPDDAEPVPEGPFYFDLTQLLDVWEPQNKQALLESINRKQRSLWDQAIQTISSIWPLGGSSTPRIETEKLRKVHFFVYRVVNRDGLLVPKGVNGVDVTEGGLLREPEAGMAIWQMSI